MSPRQPTLDPCLLSEISGFCPSVNRALADLYRSGGFIPIYERWLACSAASEEFQATDITNGLPE